MTSMTKHTLVDCFSLRARIGWQGLRSDEFKTEGPYLVTGVDFHNGRVDWDDCYNVKEERYAQDKGIQLHEHDLLITKDGTIGKTAVVVDCPEKATLNSGVFVVRAINNEVVPEFLHYVLHSHWFDLFVRNVLTGSTIKHLNQEKFYKFSFEAPDVPTQKKIVEVLESIDALIEKTRETRQKYQDIKSGLMHDLIDVLSERESDTVAKQTVAGCFKLRARIGWQGLRSDEFLDYGPYLVTGVDFENGVIDWDSCYHVSEERYAQDKGIQLHENDLLITKDGTIGKTAVVKDCPEKATLNSGVFVVRAINSKVLPEYLHYVLNSHQFELFKRNVLTGSTIKHLNQEHFYKFTFYAPKEKAEQENIVKILRSADERIATETEYLTRLNSMKLGLVQDLLSGKIDVSVLM